MIQPTQGKKKRPPNLEGASLCRQTTLLQPDACPTPPHAWGVSIPCMVIQLTKALNQPVLVVSLGYMPKP